MSAREIKDLLVRCLGELQTRERVIQRSMAKLDVAMTHFVAAAAFRHAADRGDS